MRGFIVVLALAGCVGCGYQSIEPGHRGLRYAPLSGGLKPEVLQPGRHSLGWCFMRDCGRIDDYDTTYQTQREKLFTPSSEGLAMDVNVALMYRPVMSELYQLHTEIGTDYYDAVVAPELRSAARAVLAKHSYTTLAAKLDKVEDEIEEEVKKRVRGKHVEIASITLESISYAPEVANAVRSKIVSEQDALRERTKMENEALRRQKQLEHDAAQAKLAAENEANQRKMRAQLDAEQEKNRSDLELLKKKNERSLLEQELAMAKLQKELDITNAKVDSEARILGARATAEENRAKALVHTPLSVQAASYEALGKLGGNGTTIFLGDWSRAPQFLWPRGSSPFLMPMPMTPTPTSTNPYTTSAIPLEKPIEKKPDVY